MRAKWAVVRRRPTRLADLFSGYHASRALVARVLERVGVPPPLLAACEAGGPGAPGASHHARSQLFFVSCWFCFAGPGLVQTAVQLRWSVGLWWSSAGIEVVTCRMWLSEVCALHASRACVHAERPACISPAPLASLPVNPPVESHYHMLSLLPCLIRVYHTLSYCVGLPAAGVGGRPGGPPQSPLLSWGPADLHRLVATFLAARFPLLLALNKVGCGMRCDLAACPFACLHCLRFLRCSRLSLSLLWVVQRAASWRIGCALYTREGHESTTAEGGRVGV